ncbi:MAG: hypothetical protein GY760_07255 [Deltaproteobacteria bacterium]|nr:hypothetical protein [Deltaproteobacteria bacterium]
MEKMKMEDLYATAEKERLISGLKREKISKPNKIVSLILLKTGKAFINIGNHLLKIA